MGKFRSKLKRHSKGICWLKGQSSTSNPENMKHRLKAKSRFFQPNLNIAPQPNSTSSNGLTMEAILNHEARLLYASGSQDPTVNDIAGSLKSFNIDVDETMSEINTGTFKTFQTFASNYSACSNISFKKLLTGFRANSQTHKEMLAILTALTEIIRERAGTESSTEYFILLMETIEASEGDSETIAGISLLAMGIKSVPIPVLRKKFSETAKVLMGLLDRYINNDNQSAVKYIIGCLSVLLRAQDYTTWTYSSTLQYMDSILCFTIHSKPKIRKVAQHAIASIIHGSSFMAPLKADEVNSEKTVSANGNTKVIYHPGGSRVTKFCLNQFKPEILASSQTTVLHTLYLLKETISGLKTEDIRSICENLLSIMTAPNILLRTNCLQTLHSLFLSCSNNLTGVLCGKLLTAIYEYQPDKTDMRQTLAWLVVIKQGHIHLATIDLNICINSLTRLVDICSSDLWMSDRNEIVSGASNTLKEILFGCVKPACSSLELAEKYRSQITKIIVFLGRALSAPFGEVAKFAILTLSIVFEVCGEYFSNELRPYLTALGNRYDAQSTLRVQIEHSIISAVKSMGPENVLQAIPLTNATKEIILEKTWLLPLLREGINNASLEFFANYVLVRALDCNKLWRKYTEEKKSSLAHTYELLCCQLWGLFPGFCRNPKDPENFRLIAKTLGTAVVENTEFRAPILDGIAEIVSNSSENMINELSKYAKNFLPRLFNIYTKKPNGSYESDLRNKTLEVIKLLLRITSNEILEELFQTANGQLKGVEGGSFESDSILDISTALLIYQNENNIKEFYETYIIPIMKNEKCNFISKDEQKLRKQQRKSYELLKNILTEEKKDCRNFTKHNANAMQKLLFDTLTTSCLVSQALRLKCLKVLIEHRKNLTVKDKIIVKTIPEAVVSFKDFSTKKENISVELITLIGEVYQNANQLNEFVDIVMAGFGGDQILITNTMLAMRTIVQNLTGNLGLKTLEFILEKTLVFLVQKSRIQSEAAIAFLITFTKVLPSPLVANHLETIMKSLSAMVPDTKRYCRLQLGYLLKKLCKKFTAEELIKFVPGNDEVTHRRLKKIRKELRRETRKKLNENDEAEESEDEFVEGLERKSVTIDDILADSDSDSTSQNIETSKTKNIKKKSKKETFIQESPGEIVDLADIKSIGNVLTNLPSSSAGDKKSSKQTDLNRGFKTAEDGRLIISDKLGNNDSSSDSDGTDGNIDINQNNKKKRSHELDSSDEEKLKNPSRKRKASESVRSGQSGASKYTTGGKGIHRTLGATSVKSGYSRMSTASAKSATEYSKKAKTKGDIKKKGKLDPYTYIPLSRNILNKRKRSKHAGQFKSIVQGARKGASKGLKNKVRKTYRK